MRHPKGYSFCALQQLSSKEKLLIPVLEAPSQCSLDAPSVLVNADRTNVEISVQVSIPPPEELNAMHSYLNRLYYWFLVGPIITLEWMRRTRRFCWHSRRHERHETRLDPEDESVYAERDIRSMEEGENRTVELGKALACQERLAEEQPLLTAASSESLDIRGRPRGNGCVKNHKSVFVKAAMGFGYLIINLAALPVGLSTGGVSFFRFDVEYNFQPSESSIFIWPNWFVYIDVPLWWSLFQIFCFFMYSHLVCNNQRTRTIPTLIC